MARNIVHLPSKQTYDLWAPTYDSDGNILQSLDSLGLQSILLPRLFASEPFASQLNGEPTRLPPFQIIDLGCGTGRASLALIDTLKTYVNTEAEKLVPYCHRVSESVARNIEIKGLDASTGMLDVARSRVLASSSFSTMIESKHYETSIKFDLKTSFAHYDILDAALVSPAPLADAVLCALVIEHIPSLRDFFSHIASNLIKPSGLLVLSNMHADMARGADPTSLKDIDPTTGKLVTSAGFVDTATGNKVRAIEGYPHKIPEVLEAAEKNGFELVGSENMEEVKVERWMIEKGVVNQRRGEKWAAGGVRCWFGGVFRYIGKEPATINGVDK